MRSKTTLLIATLAFAIAAVGASSASAATLYTNSAHTTPVAVGTVIFASGNSYKIIQGGGGVLDICSTNAANFKVTQNSGGVIKATITTRTLNGCFQGFSAVSTGNLQISGSSIAVGTNSAWRGTTLTGALMHGTSPITENFVSATGNPPVNGVFVQQPTAGGSPFTISLNNAGSIVGTGLNGTVTGFYTATGSYSLA
jgi:hypothetical protein